MTAFGHTGGKSQHPNISSQRPREMFPALTGCCGNLKRNGPVTSRKSSFPLFTCARCARDILDRHLLKVNGLTWHFRCLQCSVCSVPLGQNHTCFIRNKEIFCETDYKSAGGVRCARCGHAVSAHDWVRRAGNDIYHLACFACMSCKRQLSTGEEFGLLENQVLCRVHYDMMLVNLQRVSDHAGNGTDLEGDFPMECIQKTSKRPRTSFTSEQLQIMQTQFIRDKNPDAQTLQRLSEMTGLSRRVIQVWFQNCRARQKRNPVYSNIRAEGRYQTSLKSDDFFSPSGGAEIY